MAEVGRKGTPGRPQRKQNQFFEIGKVGRKTGITLRDNGVRDEYGLEPVSHIFSSPIASPRYSDRTLTSGDMHVQDSSAPEVDITIASRKPPRMPPPRSSTPKHTNIGSPKRMSTGRPANHGFPAGTEFSPLRTRTKPQANRLIDFGDAVHRSIEKQSPFKPKNVLRRSVEITRDKETASPEPSSNTLERETETHDVEEAVTGAQDELQAALDHDDGPLIIGEDNNDYDDALSLQHSVHGGGALNRDMHETPTRQSAAWQNSGIAFVPTQDLEPHQRLSARQSSKRARSSREEAPDGAEDAGSASELAASESGNKRKRISPSKHDSLVIHRDEVDVPAAPTDIAHGDSYVVEDADPPADDEVARPATKRASKSKKSKSAVPRERDPNRGLRATSSQASSRDSPSKSRQARGTSTGPISNVHLRATTPFEDAGERVSRYGRNLIQPLKYWANETRIWKYGQCEGIVRADDVKPLKRRVPKKKKQRGRKARDGSADVSEESDTESTHADEWEEDVGVIAGPVANWDPELQIGNVEDLVQEDVAFASSSIVTRDVANSEFKYAKVMTLPFFGSGVVELPPAGYKRAKNSRKMQMCFFVHDGKVLVEVGAAGAAETNQFAISKGGVFVVPRGNNYAITNESRTKTARIFFAQGCELAGTPEKQ